MVDPTCSNFTSALLPSTLIAAMQMIGNRITAATATQINVIARFDKPPLGAAAATGAVGIAVPGSGGANEDAGAGVERGAMSHPSDTVRPTLSTRP